MEADPAPRRRASARLLELLRQRFNVIVVDLPMPPWPAERQALALARQVLVVLRPGRRRRARCRAMRADGHRAARRRPHHAGAEPRRRAGRAEAAAGRGGARARPDVVHPRPAASICRAPRTGPAGAARQRRAAPRPGAAGAGDLRHPAAEREAGGLFAWLRGHEDLRPTAGAVRRRPHRASGAPPSPGPAEPCSKPRDLRGAAAPIGRPVAAPPERPPAPSRQRRRCCACARRCWSASTRSPPASWPSTELRDQLERWSTRWPDRERLRDLRARAGAARRGAGRRHAGLGPLEPLLRDDGVSDIMVNGPEQGLRRAARQAASSPACVSATPRTLADIAPEDRGRGRPAGRRIAARWSMPPAGRQPRQHRLPAAGARRRLHLDPQVLPPKRSTSTRMVRIGSMSPPMARVLEIAARCRLNIVVSGGTGSGKTTLLNALSPADRPSASASSPSRTRPSCSCSSRTSCGWRPGRQPRGPRRDHAARPGAQRAAHAARPHHRRRGARRRGLRHAAGDEHRP